MYGCRLLVERDPLCRRAARRHPAVEPLVIDIALSPNRRSAPAERQVTRGRRYRHSASHHGRLRKLRPVHRHRVPEIAPLEISRRNSGYAVRKPRIPKGPDHIHISNDVDVVDDSAAAEPAGAVPRTENLKRSQRNPADTPKSETYAESAAESDEPHQSGAVKIMPEARAGEP
jgi:hypothetical protein